VELDKSKLHLEARTDTRGHVVHKWVLNETGGGTRIEYGYKKKENTEAEKSISIFDVVGGPTEKELDDPKSPHYRYKDTGYVPGSRKELAAMQLKLAGKNKERLRHTDIDWEDLESNPRQADSLINKSNLFGSVDWEKLKEDGMEPGCGFLIDRVYASIAPKPSEGTPQARQDYTVGLESLRDRLEACRTVKAVEELLEEMRSEYNGVMMNEEEKKTYDKLRASQKEFSAEYNAKMKEMKVLENLVSAYFDKDSYEEHRDKLDKWYKENPGYKEERETVETPYGKAIHIRSAMRDKIQSHNDSIGVFVSMVKARNRSNPIHRAWGLMGKRFLAVVDWRGRKGSKQFENHVIAARLGKVKDWEWAAKEKATAPKVSEKKVRFQLYVVDQYKRIGGKEIKVDSTDVLKEKFGLREVQSGLWVLNDPESAMFHVQRSAEALSDLSDLLGVPRDKIGVNKRLALAFGARGSGSAKAHYEKVHRIINITKMSGGGSLGHELFHGFDNLIKEAVVGEPTDAKTYVLEKPEVLPAGPVRDAVVALNKAISEGDVRLPEDIEYTDKDVRKAKLNITSSSTSALPVKIRNARNASEACVAINDHFTPYMRGKVTRKTKNRIMEWKRLAVAYHSGMKESGDTVTVNSGEPVSQFMVDAVSIDGKPDKYWSKMREMGARAFSCWCEDRLRDEGRRNDYLSCLADNKHYKLDGIKPFPEGDERKKINDAMDGLVKALREEKVFEKGLLFGMLELVGG